MPKKHPRPRERATDRKNAEALQLISDDQLRAAIVQTYGCVTLVADMVGMTRRAVYYRLEQSADLREALEHAREKLVDNAQLALAGKIAAGDVAAIIFTLKTLGRDRGFDERPQVAIQVNQTNVQLTNALDELLRDDAVLERARDACEDL